MGNKHYNKNYKKAVIQLGQGSEDRQGKSKGRPTFLGVISSRAAGRNFVPESQNSTYHLNFDGVNDEIVISHAASIDNLPLGDFTIEFVAGNFPQAYKCVMTKTNSSFEGWEIYCDYFTGIHYLTVYISYDNYAAYLFPSFTLPDNQVNHIEIDFKVSTKSLKIFVNGAEVATDGSISGVLNVYDNDSLNNLIIGNEVDSSAPCAFQLRWLRVSNVARHASNFTPPSLTVCPAADASTVIRLALDEGTGTTANDTSGNSNNGTISGATWELD
jgi:hypothetical protein